MKIRSLFLVAAVTVLAFSSCDLESLAPTAKVNSQMDIDIPIASSSEKSVSENPTFLGFGSLDLGDQEDVQENIDKLESLTVKYGSTIKVSGLPGDAVIYTIDLAFAVHEATVSVLTLTFDHQFQFSSTEGFGNDFIIELSDAEVDELNDVLEELQPNFDKMVSFGVSGTSSQKFETDAAVQPVLKLLLKTALEVNP